MASENSSNHDAPVPFEVVLKTNSNLMQTPPHEYDNFMASLPLRSLGHRTIRFYQGFWISEQQLRGILAVKEDFKSRPNDLFIATYPKSGTTWLKALIFATMTRTTYPLDQNPLLDYNPHHCIAHMEGLFARGGRLIIEDVPSPRVLSTYILYSMMPDSITGSNCRISYFGPIWDHIIGYWQESKKNPEKVLFLKYEGILMEPVKYAVALAKFIGCAYSKYEEKQGVIEKIVNMCSFEKLKDLNANKEGSRTMVAVTGHVSNAAFFRKGMVGDWRNHMTYEMAEKLDKIVAEKFKIFGLDMLEMKN